MDYLQKIGLKCVEHEQITNPTLTNIDNVISQWTQKVTDRKNPYPVDGLVIVYDDTKYASTGSVTGHHATRSGYAFKWQDESAHTELVEIEWSCAASTISPVAIFTPVELEGTTVKRASLCNISECERLGMGDKGTKIEVIKANKIIPKVIKVNETVGNLVIPEHCPVCHASTEISISAASGTKTLHCSNAACPAKQLKKFARFVSKEGVNIDGISEQTLAKFINLGWIKDYADIFKLPAHVLQISQLEGFGEKSATNMMRSIEKARHVEARKLLYALSIPLCGQDVCSRLLSAYSFEELTTLAKGGSENTDEGSTLQTNLFTPQAEEALAMVPGIGPEKAGSFVKWFKNRENQEVFDRLLPELDIEQSSTAAVGNRCQGLTFVVTGDVFHFKNRNELKAYIESQGGKVTGSVSKSTSFLINNDVTSTSGKNQKAAQLGIPVISEDEFISKFQEQN